MSTMRKLIVILVLVSANLFAQELPEANRLVLEFAQKNVGKRVGNGVCRTLTNRALRHKDEVLRPDKAEIIEYSIGKVGKKVELKDALPGDIVTFDCVEILLENGSVYAAKSHIGIVKKSENGIITVLEQNVLSKKEITILKSKVVENSFNIDNVIAGKVKFYRPK